MTVSSTQLAATVARDEPSAFLEANRSVVPIRNPVAKSVQVSPLRRCATTSRACSDLKAPTLGSSLGAPVAQRVGQHDQRAVDTVIPARQKGTRGSWSDELI